MIREKKLEMFDTVNNAYNVDKKIDYSTVRSMIIRSLEKIVREELNGHSSQRRVNLNTTEKKRKRKMLLLLSPTQITCLIMTLYYPHHY